MNKVFVEYRNKDDISGLSSVASEPIEAIVTVYAPSVKVDGSDDFITKTYHLYVGQVISIEKLISEKGLSEDKMNNLKQNGIVKFVKSEVGLNPVGTEDAVFESSNAMLIRLNGMLAKLDSIGYEVPDVKRSAVR